MQGDGVALQVVAHHHGIVPDRINGQRHILEHQHRVARRHFLQQVLELRLQRIGQQTTLACGSQHFHLQRALARRQIHLLHQFVGRHRHAGSGQHHGQGRRAALVFFLRKKRHARQIGLLCQLRACGRRGTQLAHLRCGTGTEQGTKKNPRESGGAAQQTRKNHRTDRVNG